jgi:hypothetical protein
MPDPQPSGLNHNGTHLATAYHGRGGRKPAVRSNKRKQRSKKESGLRIIAGSASAPRIPDRMVRPILAVVLVLVGAKLVLSY